MKTNSPTFCGQITEKFFNTSADQFFFVAILDSPETNIKKGANN